MSAAHTRSPWRHETDYGQVGSVEDADGNIVVQVQSMGPCDHARRDEIATEIARRWNAYDELVAALGELHRAAGGITLPASLRLAVEAALAKASV